MTLAPRTELRQQIEALDLAALVQEDGVTLARVGHIWQGCCPLHDDSTPSFTVWPNGRGWYCFGCGQGGSALDYVIDRAGGDRHGKADIAAGLATLGIGGGRRLTLAPLPPHVARPAAPAPAPPDRPPDALYPYRDPTGALLYEVHRWSLTAEEQQQHDGAHKVIRPFHPGGRRMGLPAGVAPLLYRLPELLAASAAQPVFIVEGEKCADRLAEDGLVVTTNSGGAGKWPAAWSPDLAGRQVVILPDNNEAGQRHAELVATQVRPYAAAVKVLALPGLAEGEDVYDFLTEHTVDALLCLAEAAPALPAVDPDTGEIAGGQDAPRADMEILTTRVLELESRVAILESRQERTITLLLGNERLHTSDRLAIFAYEMLCENLDLQPGQRTNLTQKDLAAQWHVSEDTASKWLDRLAGLNLAQHHVHREARAVLDGRGRPKLDKETGRPLVHFDTQTVLSCTARPFEVEIAGLCSPPGATGKQHGGLRDCPKCHAPEEMQETIKHCRNCGHTYNAQTRKPASVARGQDAPRDAGASWLAGGQDAPRPGTKPAETDRRRDLCYSRPGRPGAFDERPRAAYSRPVAGPALLLDL